LNIAWELVPENTEFGAYAGQGERKPAPVEGTIREVKEGGKLIQFRAPSEKDSNFRMFVYAKDGNNNVAVANIPFHIREE